MYVCDCVGAGICVYVFAFVGMSIGKCMCLSVRVCLHICHLSACQSVCLHLPIFYLLVGYSSLFIRIIMCMSLTSDTSFFYVNRIKL